MKGTEANDLILLENILHKGKKLGINLPISWSEIIMLKILVLFLKETDRIFPCTFPSSSYPESLLLNLSNYLYMVAALEKNESIKP